MLRYYARTHQVKDTIMRDKKNWLDKVETLLVYLVIIFHFIY